MSKKVTNELVQSIGNSWIVCRSKTYADRIYYFNTLTGKSVWNLSEPEMEKAKRTTHILGKSNNFFTDNCPEPSISPTDYEHGNKDIQNQLNVEPSKQPQVHNEQVNNRISRAAVSNFLPMNSMQYGIPASHMCNPLIWHIPPQPVVITPIDQADSVTPTIHASETFIPVSNTLIPLSSRFKSLSEINNSKSFDTFNTREILNNSLNAVNSECNNKNNKIFKTKCDLREILSARKKRTLTNVGAFQSIIGDSKNLNSEHNYVPLYMKDEEWLLENFESNRYNLDTSELRKLANLDNNTDFWIVTDAYVLLNNTNFLTVLIHSDKQCNLIVPYAVLEEIQRAAKSNNSEAQKALYFISQQINLKKVAIDNERLSEHGLAIEDEILGCCSRLSEQGILFVLFTNSIELLDMKGRIIFPILTIREAKILTCHQFHSRTHTFNSPLNVKEANIKITIPNEPQDETAPTINDISYILTDNRNIEDIPSVSNVNKVEEANIRAETVREPNIQENPTESITSNTSNSSMITNKNTIKLKRNLSNHTSTSNDMKTFKWRRKRARTDNWSEKGTESDTTNSTDILDDNPNQSLCEYKKSEICCITDGSKIVNNSVLVPSYSLKSVNTNLSICNTSNSEHTDPKKPVSSKEEKNVMFEITSKVMEDNLRTKCDEWVSRFTQILEEVLTQVLYKEPKFVCEAMPPPWSLYEAVECTRRKFHSDGDVVDATNKFCNILFDIGASRGKVKSNISPQQYMDLYSYGVYLTDALQEVLNDCEDLKTASELLAKLLKDIQDPPLDLQYQNSSLRFIKETTERFNVTEMNTDERIEQDIIDNEEEKGEEHLTNEEKLNVHRLEEIPQNSVRSIEYPTNSEIFKIPDNYKPNIESVTTPPRYNKNNKVLISPSKYNLRSNKRHTAQNIEKSTLCVTDRESNFFNSLYLIKRTISGIDVNDSNKELDTEDLSPKDQNANNHLVENYDNKVISDTNVNEEKTIEPKVVRNFVKCLDFEERLQKKYNFTNYDDQENEECNYSDEAYYDEMGEDYQYEDFYEYGEEEEFEEEDSMKCFLDNFLYKTKGILSVVKFFCEKSHDVLQSSANELDKSEILREAEETHISITNICEALDSILKRETCNSEDSIRVVSKNPDLNCVEISEEQAESYRTVISKCLEQGNILKESVTCIINVIKLNA